uniref:Uncharacterized protein n=1 Tax=Kwoniella pini CBS 10737 TaxID=1296096 RepID=A0A1B9HS43_9TREE|nr:uncharacterized protein I206_07897 [Kwoniella pini CBS 10737]OCF46112.1 hypothetical protein I206_07897 [Kwoniella pini CBS 10737]
MVNSHSITSPIMLTGAPSAFTEQGLDSRTITHGLPFHANNTNWGTARTINDVELNPDPAYGAHPSSPSSAHGVLDTSSKGENSIQFRNDAGRSVPAIVPGEGYTYVPAYSGPQNPQSVVTNQVPDLAHHQSTDYIEQDLSHLTLSDRPISYDPYTYARQYPTGFLHAEHDYRIYPSAPYTGPVPPPYLGGVNKGSVSKQKSHPGQNYFTHTRVPVSAAHGGHHDEPIENANRRSAGSRHGSWEHAEAAPSVDGEEEYEAEVDGTGEDMTFVEDYKAIAEHQSKNLIPHMKSKILEQNRLISEQNSMISDQQTRIVELQSMLVSSQNEWVEKRQRIQRQMEGTFTELEDQKEESLSLQAKVYRLEAERAGLAAFTRAVLSSVEASGRRLANNLQENASLEQRLSKYRQKYFEKCDKIDRLEATLRENDTPGSSADSERSEGF